MKNVLIEIVTFVLGCLFTVIMVNGPLRNIREQNSFKKGVVQGASGKFKLVIDKIETEVKIKKISYHYVDASDTSIKNEYIMVFDNPIDRIKVQD